LCGKKYVTPVNISIMPKDDRFRTGIFTVYCPSFGDLRVLAGLGRQCHLIAGYDSWANAITGAASFSTAVVIETTWERNVNRKLHGNVAPIAPVAWKDVRDVVFSRGLYEVAQAGVHPYIKAGTLYGGRVPVTSAQPLLPFAPAPAPNTGKFGANATDQDIIDGWISDVHSTSFSLDNDLKQCTAACAVSDPSCSDAQIALICWRFFHPAIAHPSQHTLRASSVNPCGLCIRRIAVGEDRFNRQPRLYQSRWVEVAADSPQMSCVVDALATQANLAIKDVQSRGTNTFLDKGRFPSESVRSEAAYDIEAIADRCKGHPNYLHTGDVAKLIEEVRSTSNLIVEGLHCDGPLHVAPRPSNRE
jgi:hypothetical protein